MQTQRSARYLSGRVFALLSDVRASCSLLFLTLFPAPYFDNHSGTFGDLPQVAGNRDLDAGFFLRVLVSLVGLLLAFLLKLHRPLLIQLKFSVERW